MLCSSASTHLRARGHTLFFVHRAAATAVMWSLVAPGGALVLIEDGSAKGSHTVRSARQMVLRPSSPSSEPGDVMWRRVRTKHVGRVFVSLIQWTNAALGYQTAWRNAMQ